MRYFLIVFFFIFSITAFSQAEKDSVSRTKVRYLITSMTQVKNSRNIWDNENMFKLISYGERAIPYLIELYSDTSKTKIYSTCLKKNLDKGEVAIIATDLIEGMPYFSVTGMQNCTMEVCESGNFIEFYLNAINRNRSLFINKYTKYYNSVEHKDVQNGDRKKDRRYGN